MMYDFDEFYSKSSFFRSYFGMKLAIRSDGAKYVSFNKYE